MGKDISDKHLSDCLVDSCFYLNSIAEFNDPFDMGVHVTINKDPKRRVQKFNKTLKGHRPDLNWKQRRQAVNKMMCAPDQLPNIRAGYEKSIADTGAICFTTDARNLLMWSHYSTHHKGIVLQFYIANDIRIMSRALKVYYSNAYPIIDWVDDNQEFLGKIVRTKHHGWEYEKEYRIFVVDGANTYLPFQPEALTGLIFGCRADLQLKQRVVNILEQRAYKNLMPLNVYKAVKHQRDYRVTIEKDHSLKWPS